MFLADDLSRAAMPGGLPVLGRLDRLKAVELAYSLEPLVDRLPDAQAGGCARAASSRPGGSKWGPNVVQVWFWWGFGGVEVGPSGVWKRFSWVGDGVPDAQNAINTGFLCVKRRAAACAAARRSMQKRVSSPRARRPGRFQGAPRRALQNPRRRGAVPALPGRPRRRP